MYFIFGIQNNFFAYLTILMHILQLFHVYFTFFSSYYSSNIVYIFIIYVHEMHK
jgi:hypothetical protein